MTEDFTPQQLASISSKDLVLCSQQQARDVLAFEEAQQLMVLPMSIIRRGNRRVGVFAVSERCPPDIKQALRFATGYENELYSVPHESLMSALFEAYHHDGARLIATAQALKSDEPTRTPDTSLQARATVGDAGRLLAAILDLAIAQRATDVQLTPRRNGVFLTLRVYGERRGMAEPLCSLELAKKLVNRIRILAKLDTTQGHLPQDGAFEVELPHGNRAVRLSLLPTVHGTQVALRLFGSVEYRDINTIFVDPVAAELAERALQATSGLIVLAGSTGSGKTTTLYSFMKYLANRNLNVLSLEDPVEAEIPGVTQTSIETARGFSYAAALKSALRQDPDAILIGEVRDPDVAAIAYEAALTGHLVLTTVHSGNVKEVLLRLQQLLHQAGVKDLPVLAPLRLILCQKLVPELCSSCRVLDLEASKQYGIKAAKPVGCSRCDYSGNSSRLCVVEGLYSHGLIESTLTKSRIDELEAEGLFVSPKKQLMRLFSDGRISSEVVERDYFDSVWMP